MKVKEESEKAGLKLNIQKTKIMASGPITSWQIDGETAADFIFFGSKITADGDCSHEIKRCLLLGRKAMSNLDSILKSGIPYCIALLCRQSLVGYNPWGRKESDMTEQFHSLTHSFLYRPTLTSIHDYLKTIALTR